MIARTSPVHRRGRLAATRGALAFVLLVSLAGIIVVVTVEPAPSVALADLPALHAGDIVFRRGQSLRSRVVLLRQSGRGEYSHVGIVVIVRGEPFIVDAVPSQRGTGVTGIVAIRRVRDFLSPTAAAAVKVMRMAPRDQTIATNAANVAVSYASRAVQFDDDYDRFSSDRVYCTELVWRVFLESGLELLDSLPEATDAVLLPSTLLRSRHLREVSRLSSSLRPEH